MNHHYFTLAAVLLASAVTSQALAQGVAPVGDSYTYNGKTYYKVTSEDSAQDTGTEVCAQAGLTCAGYTALTTEVCTAFHEDAKTVSDANGSRAGFYCDGAPQGGVCGQEQNTCHICPMCNVNMDCDTEIGGLYRETYVECSGGVETVAVASPGRIERLMSWTRNWWDTYRSTVARSFDLYRQKLAVLLRTVVVKRVTIQVTGPNGVEDVQIPTDSYVCEFYQANKKLVTCGALAAADQFCVTAMNSQYAKAELCQENGIIVCSNPCTTSPQQIIPNRCTFDNDRPRGNQAEPLLFCNETKTIQIDTNTLGQKKAGEVCAHGGECATGICLGQPSDSGIKYFCSCSQTRHDTSCGK